MMDAEKNAGFIMRVKYYEYERKWKHFILRRIQYKKYLLLFKEAFIMWMNEMEKGKGSAGYGGVMYSKNRETRVLFGVFWLLCSTVGRNTYKCVTGWVHWLGFSPLKTQIRVKLITIIQSVSCWWLERMEVCIFYIYSYK